MISLRMAKCPARTPWPHGDPEQDACRLTPFTNRRNISAIQISPSPQNLYFSGMHMHGDEISITRRTLA
jgi:hypothetical protein